MSAQKARIRYWSKQLHECEPGSSLSWLLSAELGCKSRVNTRQYRFWHGGYPLPSLPSTLLGSL